MKRKVPGVNAAIQVRAVTYVDKVIERLSDSTRVRFLCGHSARVFGEGQTYGCDECRDEIYRRLKASHWPRGARK